MAAPTECCPRSCKDCVLLHLPARGSVWLLGAASACTKGPTAGKAGNALKCRRLSFAVGLDVRLTQLTPGAVLSCRAYTTVAVLCNPGGITPLGVPLEERT